MPSAADTGTRAGEDDLAVSLSNIARALQSEGDSQATLVAITDAAVALVPGCDEASISLVVGRREVRSRAASGELARVVDALQSSVGQGPCLDTAYEQETVRVGDMSSETRWPAFCSAALEAGAASMLALQLFVEGDNLGALNLFSRSAGAFDDESEHIGLMFAAHAAIAYSAVEEQAKLRRVVATRQLIGQAQGILMERHRLTADQAFTALVRASQDTNLKLRALAERLVVTGTLDPPA